MESDKNLMYASLLLAGVAGFSDTVTFVAADEMFSAHVTGNFIVFAYDLIQRSDLSAWVRLITFPVFVMAVLSGGALAKRATNKQLLLLIEGIILLFCAIASSVLQMLYGAALTSLWSYTIVFIIVFAMGLQNVYGKLFSKATFGPTTMMTGNVTQASLELGDLIKNRFANKDQWASLKKTLTVIVGFIVGCLLGAVGGAYFGLAAIALPGIALLTFVFTSDQEKLKVV